MPNIFDGITKLNDEDLKNQIATLEEVTMSNALSQMGQTFSNKTLSLYASIRKAIDGKNTKVPEVIKIEERILNKYEILKDLKRPELEQRIRNVLIQKINSATSLYLEKPSDDRISVEIIELACRNYKKEINSNLTYAQKADVIRHRYDEKILSQLQEKLSKQNAKEKKETEEAIQRELDKMPGERKEELRKALNVEELNGEIVRNVFVSTAGVSATLIVMETAGFGAYVALTTVIHAIFTTLLGVTLPFTVYTGATSVLSILTGPVGMLLAGGGTLLMLNKNKNKIIYELSAQIVWLSVSAYGRKFTPKEEELPSWLPSMERDREIDEIKSLHGMMEENERMQDKIHKQDVELRRANNIIQENHKKIQELIIKRDNTEESLKVQKKEKINLAEELASAKQKYQSIDSLNSVSSEELEQAKNEVNRLLGEKEIKEKEIDELFKLIQLGEEEMDKLKMDNSNYQDKIIECNTEIEYLKNELEISRQNVEMRADKNAKELGRRWQQFFAGLEFETKVFKEVVKNFEYNEFIEIEMKLREIEDAKDPGAVSGNRGKVGRKRYHVEFSTYSGFPSRIFYKATERANNKKTAIVTDIVKHNDARYNDLCK